MNAKLETRWIRVAVYVLATVLYVYFVGQHAAVILVRHSASPAAPFGLDLKSCLQSERPEIRLAAAQRVADDLVVTADLLPIIRSVWESDERVAELGWFLAQAIARMDDDASELIALAAMDGFETAEQRFEKLSADRKADALLRLLASLDLATESDVRRADWIVLRIGSLGANARVELPLEATSDRVRRVVAASPVDDALAETMATRLLERYRNFELPSVAELALLQLGEPAVAAVARELENRLRPEVQYPYRMGLYRTLSRMGPAATDATAVLIRALEFEPVHHAFGAAMSALVAIEPVDRTIAADAIRAAKVAARWEAAGYQFAPIEAACEAALQALGDEATIDAMIAELQGQRLNDDGVRVDSIDSAEVWPTVRQLGKCGRRAERAKDVLAACLQSRAPAVQIEAAWAYVRVGGDVRSASEVLATFLDPFQAAADDIGLALMVIAEIGWPDDAPAEPLLRLLETGWNPELRVLASNALHRIYPQDNDLTDVFVTRLVAESDPQVRRVLLNWLEVRLTESEASGIPNVGLDQTLEWLRTNWSETSRATSFGERELQLWLAERSIRSASGEGAIALAQWLAEDPDFPAPGIELFDRLGEARQAAVPILREILRSGNPPLVRVAIERLGQMGDLARPAYSDIAATGDREMDAVLRKIDPQAYVASTARIWEWFAVWLLPLALVLVGAVDWGWTNARPSAIISRAETSVV